MTLIFVWTLRDIIGLAFLGITVLFLFIGWVVDRYERHRNKRPQQ